MLRKLLARIGKERRGSALVEFACAFPVLIALYIGSYALSDQLAASRKVTVTARTITDLTTRFGALSTAQLNTVLAASAQVLVPLDASRATIRVSELLVTGPSSATVVWSQARNGTALTANTTLTIPTNMATTNTYLIFGEVTYTYQPVVGLGALTNMTFYDKSYMSPRLVSAIPLSQ
jgi:Flp pilus assembly protein TadG